MHTTVIDMENVTLQDLLTVDTHGEIIYIQDKAASEPYKLVANRQVFFSGLFADVEKKGITIIQDNDKISVNLEQLLESLNKSRKSCVVLIEGFAGCGKSTLVQYVLWKQLRTYNYDYSFYNYDLEAQNDLIIHDKSGNKIKKSSIYEAIKKSLFEQFIKVVEKNNNVMNDFESLLNLCRDYQPFNSLYHDFYNTDTFEEIHSYVYNDLKNKKDIIIRNLLKQSSIISSSACLLALDCLFRLAMYKNRMIEKLYICYDNLDAIEDADDLVYFDDNLADFRGLIDRFIILLQSKNFFTGVPTPHFVILVTYRKITAILANIARTPYKEVSTDRYAGTNQNNSIYHIDATSIFSYRKIVAKRKRFFEEYFSNTSNINQETKDKLMENFSSWDRLNQNLEIMHDRYACLWNKNYRTCSLIANKLFSEESYDFLSHIKFIENSKVNDGYDFAVDNDGNNILCTYYGGSAILLSSVCKVFNDCKIWDDLLNLAPLGTDQISYKNISFSRIILTYMYNREKPVSLKELFNTFCKNRLFSYKDLCHNLSTMLARNLDGVWRRPIYYSGECILSEKADDIEKALLKECKQWIKSSNSYHNYSFQLCDSGKAYVERVMQEFEFFSNRLSNSNKALYLYDNIYDIEQIIQEVFNAVSYCCENMLDFRKQYIKINSIPEEKYLSLLIHPITNNKRTPQLHTERIIFSHIAYLNNVRQYFLDEDVTADFEKRKEYNAMFIKHIGSYLELYTNRILPYDSLRSATANKLGEIVDKIKYAINNKIDDPEILFISVSLEKNED